MILMLLVKLLDVIDIPYETHTAVQAADQTAKMAVSSLGQVFVAVIAAFFLAAALVSAAVYVSRRSKKSGQEA